MSGTSSQYGCWSTTSMSDCTLLSSFLRKFREPNVSIFPGKGSERLPIIIKHKPYMSKNASRPCQACQGPCQCKTMSRPFQGPCRRPSQDHVKDNVKTMSRTMSRPCQNYVKAMPRPCQTPCQNHVNVSK
jgi:hypothetical protein